MANVRFELDADAAKVVRAYELATDAQEKTEEGARKLGKEATKAHEEIQKATEKTIRIYKLADEAATSAGQAMTRPRRGGTRPGPQIYPLAPVASPTVQQVVRARPAGVTEYGLAPTPAEIGASIVGNLEARRLASIREREETRMIMQRTRNENIMEQLDQRLGELGRLAGEKAAAERASRQFAQQRQRIARGALAIGAAVSGVAYAAEQELNRFADTIVSVEDMIGPLASVGDNMKDRARIRRRILGESIGRGIDANAIAAMDFTLQSAAADLPDDVREEMRRSAFGAFKLQGANLQQTVTGINSAYQLMRNQLPPGAGGVRAITNKLALAADVGAFEIDAFTPYMGMVLGSFKSMGYSMDEALAATAVVSRAGMRPETYATALRNIPLMLAKGQEKGFKSTGDFARDMQQLAGLETDELLAVVGRDPFTSAKFLSENLGLYDQTRRQLQRMGPGQDLFGQKLSIAYKDPQYATSEAIKAARRIQENAAAIKAQDPWTRDAVEEWELRKAGAATTFHPMFKWLERPAVWLETLNDAIWGDFSTGSELLSDGLQAAIAEARAAGDMSKAGYLSLKYGNIGSKSVESYYIGKDGKRVYTGADDANRFLSLRAAGMTGLSDSEFLQFLQIEANQGQAEANKYLAQVGFEPGGNRASGGGDVAELLQAAAENLTAAAEGLRGGEAAADLPAVHRE